MPEMQVTEAERRAISIQQTAKNAPIGAGCLVLFGLPFVGVGIFVLMIANGAIEAQKNGPVWMLYLFATVFGGAGLGIIAMAVYVLRSSQRDAEFVNANPGAPWLWRKDWAEGCTREEGRNGSIFLWFFAGFWNLISWGAFVGVYQKGELVGPAAFVLLFPVIGALLLIWAIYTTAQNAKFRGTRLLFSPNPLRVGGTMTAQLETRRLDADAVVVATLSCIRHEVHGSGKSRTVKNITLWTDEQEIPAARMMQGPNGYTLPLDFVLSSQGLETQTIDSSTNILWKVRTTADLSGVDLDASFEVPVYGTNPNPDPLPVRETRFARSYVPKVIRPESFAGGTRYDFINTTTAGGKLSSLLWTAAFTGGSIALWKSPLPWGFAAFLTFIAILVWFGLFDTLFGHSTVTTDGDRLAFGYTNGIVTMGDSIGRNDVDRIEIAATDDQSKRTYTINLVPKAGRPRKIGRSMPRKNDADWFVAEMERWLGRA